MCVHPEEFSPRPRKTGQEFSRGIRTQQNQPGPLARGAADVLKRDLRNQRSRTCSGLVAAPPVGPPRCRAAVQQHVCQKTQKQAAHYQHRSHGNGPAHAGWESTDGGGGLTDTSITPPPPGAAAQNQTVSQTERAAGRHLCSVSALPQAQRRSGRRHRKVTPR